MYVIGFVMPQAVDPASGPPRPYMHHRPRNFKGSCGATIGGALGQTPMHDDFLGLGLDSTFLKGSFSLQGSGFMVWASCFGVQGLGFRLEGVRISGVTM